MKYLLNYKIFETKEDLIFKALPLKKGRKTINYNVVYKGQIIGQIKWFSRLRGYGYFPIVELEVPVQDFIKKLNQERRGNKS